MSSEMLAFHGGSPAVTTAWSRDWPLIGKEEIVAVVDLLGRGVLSIYDRSDIIAELEDAFASYHSVADKIPLALSQNSGTSTLHAAYFGLELGPGDEVIVPTYTFLATVTTLLQCGAVPVFADMDPVTLTLDPESVRERISERTRAIVVTHMWGHPAAMADLGGICSQYRLPLVEDCSHAHGATLNGQKVGTFGDAACFSLEGHKPIAAGEGGVLLTRSRVVYERALLLGHFGRRAKDEVTIEELKRFVDTGFGHKYRMHPLGAAMALAQLQRLDGRNQQREQNLNLLSSVLEPAPGIHPPVTRSGATRGGWYGYKPTYASEELGGLPLPRYVEALHAEGVQIKRPGSPPLHRLPTFSLARSEAQDLALPWANTLNDRSRFWSCPVADEVFPTLLSLPTFSGACEQVITEYGEAFAKVGRAWRDLL